ncbi:MAG: hypothetical protein EZS28_050828 [Streblomastix strix]|uniref:Uncharacterized protein n=1 Tax=Streblomastix strix TaxID=222440 RepID=A0A5J4T8C5_9EUKA|nr:MAG: hypothetical protein EZS28_050828 [Streblomastix strix]
MKQSDYSALLKQIHHVDNNVSAYEADAAIQGLKGTVRKERIYGSFDPSGLVADAIQTQQLVQQIWAPQQLQSQQEANFNHDLNINDRLDQPSQRGPSNIRRSAPDHSIEDSDDERMELFRGYNRYQIQTKQVLNPYSQNTDQQIDFAQQVDTTQEDNEDEQEQAIEEQELEEDNAETNRELQYIGELNWGQDDFAQQVDTTQEYNEDEQEQAIEEQELEEDNAETNRELQYIGELNWGQEPVNPHYNKRPFVQINDFGYRVIDQGLSVYAKKKTYDIR